MIRSVARPAASKWAYDTGTHYHGVGCPAAWGTGEVESAASSTANVSQDGHGHLLITPIRSGSYWVSGRIETTASTFAAPTGGEMKVVASIRQPSPSQWRGVLALVRDAGRRVPSQRRGHVRHHGVLEVAHGRRDRRHGERQRALGALGYVPLWH